MVLQSPEKEALVIILAPIWGFRVSLRARIPHVALLVLPRIYGCPMCRCAKAARTSTVERGEGASGAEPFCGLSVSYSKSEKT